MKYNINNISFIRRIFKRKIKRGVAFIACNMDCMAMADKVDFVIERICSISFKRAVVFVEYWENEEVLKKTLRSCNISTYKFVREYRQGNMRPGLLVVEFAETIDIRFLRNIISKHFNFEHAVSGSLQIIPYVLIDDDVRIYAFKLYDDRGFYEYVIRNY